MFGTSRI